MHPVAFRKAMIEAYMAGFAAAIEAGLKDYPTKQEARDWFDNEYGQQESEECDCCEDNDEE
jgi:hypothetical protein